MSQVRFLQLALKALAAHPRGRDWTCEQAEDELGETLCSPLGFEHPVEAARRLLGVEGRVIRGPWTGPETGPAVN